MNLRVKSNQRVEGIRKTNARSWAVVLSEPGESVVPGRSPRVLILGAEFAGPGAKAKAIDAAGTNREFNVLAGQVWS